MNKKILALCLIGLSGCVQTAHDRDSYNSAIYAQVEELGEMEYLDIVSMKAVKRNDLLNVQATVFNTDNDNQQLYYRFKWIDANGFVVGDEEPWKPMLIYAQQTKTINAVAPNPSVSDFRMEVQSPDNIIK